MNKMHLHTFLLKNLSCKLSSQGFFRNFTSNKKLLNIQSIQRFCLKFTRKSSFRGKYNVLTSKDVEYFKTVLSSSKIIQEPNDLIMYNTDWLKSHKGNFLFRFY